ncbi:MAG: hypothetical protein WC333_00320 [Dehalococcoidia bacterium]|jgi:hypothetical protein
MSALTNIELKKIIQQMAVYIHEQAVQIRKDFEIPPGTLKLYSDYAIYGTDDNEFFAFHYVVHVDNETERFFIITWTSATQDEYLDSINYEKNL